MKRLQIEIAVVVLLLIIITSLWFMFKHQRAERIRLSDNQNTLLQDVVRFKTSDSLNVLQVGKLTLSNSEFKKYNADLMETVDELNLKVRRLQNASSTGTVTVTEVQTIIKDSTIYRDKEPIIIKCIDFSDGWVTATGCADNGVFNGQITSRDTLQTFADRVPRKFLFIKFGTKSIRQTIISKNPHTIIEYHKVIELKK